ncbi:glycoside hydrolase family 2 protein [Kitasatospora sp. NBC_00315]|uniref:glycoside hydrolase family 2 protein n=1 Tax=Kitasatospora sp. NBC_00315 TaxID=2975963 RepID=UPI003251C13B
MTVRTPLTDGWTLRLDPSRHTPAQAPASLLHTAVPAQVPGCVHTDLLAAGLIPDPYLGLNETEVAWVGRADWTYDTAVPARDGAYERADLVFEGLDTVAEITLGGRRLGATRNMHRSYRFEVTELLDADRTPLSVRFTSAYVEAEAVRALLGERPNSYPEPTNHIRKMACGFGWDWGPTLVTAGIWRQARIEQWSTARLAEVRPLVTVRKTTDRKTTDRETTDPERTEQQTAEQRPAEQQPAEPPATGQVELRVALERTTAGALRELTLTAEIGGSRHQVTVAAGEDSALVTLRVPDAQVWWPRGYGAQPLYDCLLRLTDEHGIELDSWSRRIGFRTVELDTAADEHGSGFTLVVNGIRIFARGVNWIPDDVFPTRVTPARYRERLQQAADANVDLVRVWGGGIYEDHAFYDVCDELGLLVWQDFLFACAAYPEEQPLRGEVEAEARENVARLMPHPSLVLWNGNNENLWGFAEWGWESDLAGDSWGEGYYLGLLPRVVAQTDPTRPYWAGSPWSGSWDHTPNHPDHGTSHSWEVWNRQDHGDYLSSVPRFVAEFGWQAPPTHATLLRALPDEALAPDSPGMLHHQKAEDGNGKLDRGLAHHFTAPADFDEWHYLTQVNQARAVATGVEHWRSHWPRCAGTVLWQLNDCWPVTSWAAIDGDARPKPLYHELRRLYADRLLTFQQREGRLVLAVVNQGAQRWRGGLTVRRVSADGAVLAAAELAFDAEARAVALVEVPAAVAGAGDPGKELWTAEADGLRAWHFAVGDADFAYPEGAMDITVTPSRGGADITVTARTLLRDLLLQADRLHPDARTDQGLTTLLPGESTVLRVRDWPDAGPTADLTAALRCVNSPRSRGRRA